MHGVIDIRVRTAQNVRRTNSFIGPNARGLTLCRFDLPELEFSEYGRDPRFLPGWWIGPLCFVALASVCVFAFA